MNIDSYPSYGLTAEYPDITLSSVVYPVNVTFVFNGVSAGSERYFPDASNKVYIQDIGKMAENYFTSTALTLSPNISAQRILVQLNCIEDGSTYQYASFYLWYSKVDFGGSVNPTHVGVDFPLTRCVERITAPGRKEYLGFYTPVSVKAYVVALNEYNVATGYEVTLYYRSDSMQLFEADVSPNTVATLAYTTVEKLIYYRIFASDRYSIKYVVDQAQKHTQNTFVFRNCFGSQEAFTATGDLSTDRQWERERGFIRKSEIIVRKKAEIVYTVNSGPVNDKELMLLEDLVDSEDVAWINNGHLIPVTIIDQGFASTSRKSKVNTVEFSFIKKSMRQIRSRYIAVTADDDIFSNEFDDSFN